MKEINKKLIILIVAVALFFVFYFLFVGGGKKVDVEFGFTFSQKYASEFGLDWRKAYQEILRDFNFKRVRLIAYWDLIESENNNFNFEDLDWQIKKAQEKGIKVLLDVGKKAPRWPECHIPKWAENLKEDDFERELLDYIENVVLRYKSYSNIEYWQVENEPFFSFGEKCKTSNLGVLKKEVELVRKLDVRKIVITDSGEFGTTILPAYFADIVGITIYKDVFVKEVNKSIDYPFSPEFYFRKAKVIESLSNKKVIGIETQAEAWGDKPLPYLSFEKQRELMPLDKFKYLFDFAHKTGIQIQYLWGVEWWYFMKEKGDSSYWNYSKSIINKY
ncbi:hypothetical protein HRbin34_00496 [bacterium HR34]|nr:hypothetical protein HRbin34_00496 [bacterium HR34]